MASDFIHSKYRIFMASPKKKKKTETPEVPLPRVHPELSGFNITINSFGELQTSFEIDKINQFLNKNVKDKKFKGRDDIDGVPNQ